MKKIIIINAGPRKKYNTAKLLKQAELGALDAEAQVEYFNLYDYDFRGCISCFACKRKNSKTNGLCAVKDSVREILQNA